MKGYNKTQLLAILIAVLISICVYFLSSTVFIKGLENFTSDFRTNNFRDASLLNKQITIIDIDDASMQELGPWAWPRKVHGQVVSFLQAKGASSISFDVLFVEKDLTNQLSDNQFSNLLKDTSTCLAMMFHTGEVFKHRQNGPDSDVQKWAIDTLSTDKKLISQVNVAAPNNLFAKNAKWVAFIDISSDADGVFRRRLAVRQMNGRYYASIDVATVAMLKGIKAKDIIYHHGKYLELKGVKSKYQGNLKIPIDDKGQMRLNYYGDSFTFDYISYYKILDAYRWENKIIPYRQIRKLLTKHFKIKLLSLLEEDPGQDLWLGANELIDKDLLKLLNGNDEFVQSLDIKFSQSLSKILNDILAILMDSQDAPDVFSANEINNILKKYFQILLTKKILNNSTSPQKDYASLLNKIKNRIFIIGSTAKELHDQRVTPFDADAPGVEIVATGINNILEEDFLTHSNQTTLFLILICSAWLVAIITLIFSSVRSAIIVTTLSFIYLLVSIVLYRWYNYLIPLFTPILVMSLSYISTLVIQQIIEGKERGILKQTFGRFVSPALVNQIIKNPSMVSLGGETRNMTVSFSGMVDFSHRCAKLKPQEVVQLLQESHTHMTETILGTGGTLDKFEGDTIMAFWGAPVPSTDHHLKGCSAILDNLKILKELNSNWIKRGWQPLSMEAGLNSGNMVVGNIGSLQKMNYSIIGDVVNTAARVRGANKIYGTNFVVTQFTWEYIKDELVTRLLDPILFIGKSEPIKVYEVICYKKELTKQLSDKLICWQEAKQAYIAQDWVDAKNLFVNLQKKYGKDKPSEVFLSRIKTYQQTPPNTDWDGRYVMQTK